MGKIVAVEYVTLDGVMQAPGAVDEEGFDHPGWTMPYFSDELGEVQNETLFACDALLLGRLTYEAFAQSWPEMTDEDGYADRMNSLPKHVATSRGELRWNASPLGGDVVTAVQALKAGDAGNLLIYGSSVLVDTLTRHRLIDEYKLMVFPVVIGQGKRLFKDGTETDLRLTDTRATSTGVAVLTYAASSSPGGS